MNSVLDVFLGDPIYDNQNRVVRRNFGAKNMIAIIVICFIGYSLICKMKPNLGNMRGGVEEVEGVEGGEGVEELKIGTGITPLDIVLTIAIMFLLGMGAWTIALLFAWIFIHLFS